MHSEHVPEIPVLRERVYKSEEEYGSIPWISKHIIHPYVSIYFTSLLLRLGLTGDQATYLMMGCAISGPTLFLFGGKGGYLAGSFCMIVSWILDHSDGEVRRFRNEPGSSFGVYVDRFTHRVSYPLLHIAIGISLFWESGTPGYLLFGGLVAYFYQLVVVHDLDKTLIQVKQGGVELNPVRAARLRVATNFPASEVPLRWIVGGYFHLIQNNTFVVLLSISALLGYPSKFYIIYGSVLISHWLVLTALDFSFKFRPQSGSEAIQDPAVRNAQFEIQ